ncbi:MAG TPA: helix-turn-helix domain-containing protein [Steroidobacteraceae bacterium]|nr:helix-turn-helix domain-containing protein [Steroidobacteraceae bacterium]
MSSQFPADKSLARPGAALKALRRQHGWTLAEVSQRTGLPASTLSKIENDKMSLSFDKLSRLSSGLQIDISTLFRGANGEEAQSALTGRRSIVRAGEGKAIETRNYSHLYPAWELLNKKIIPIVAELHARSLEEFGELVHHPGEEYAIVLEGEVDLYTSLYAPVHLKTGDSIYFDSGMGHAYIAASEGRCRVLSLCSAPETQIIAANAQAVKTEPTQKARPATRRRRRA